MPVMNDDQLFIIAPGVEFVDPGDVPARVRKNFEHHQGDVILTHLNTRKGSKIVGREAAALLKEFTFPKSLAQAIVSFSASYKKNPQQIAEDTFELLKEMQH